MSDEWPTDCSGHLSPFLLQLRSSNGPVTIETTFYI
jgi:hypothetical protein